MQENSTFPARVWGLRHDITPSLGARLVQLLAEHHSSGIWRITSGSSPEEW